MAKQRQCSNCEATFGDEQFCPTCGQWVDPLTEGPADDEFEEFALGDRPSEGEPVVSTAPASTSCPSCGAENPATNRHCEDCGARLSQGPLPVAPQPMVQTTAGVRAVIAISALLIGVVLIALLVNLFGGGSEDGATATTSTTDTTEAATPVVLRPLAVTCSSELGDPFVCENLIDGDEATIWNDASLGGAGAEITFTFAPAVDIQQIVIRNIADETRFRLNFRLQSFTITDNAQVPFSNTIPDQPGSHTVPYVSQGTTTLTLTVTSTYAAEPVAGETQIPFEQLAIEEVVFVGLPSERVSTSSPTTSSATTSTAP